MGLGVVFRVTCIPVESIIKLYKYWLRIRRRIFTANPYNSCRGCSKYPCRCEHRLFMTARGRMCSRIGTFDSKHREKCALHVKSIYMPRLERPCELSFSILAP